MKLEILAAFLHQEGLGVPGESLFINMMPESCKQGIVLRLPLYGVEIDHELPRYFRATLQAIARAQSNTPGEQLARQVQDVLTMQNRVLASDSASVMINQLLPKTLPIVYPRSDGNGIEWSINFTASYVEM